MQSGPLKGHMIYYSGRAVLFVCMPHRLSLAAILFGFACFGAGSVFGRFVPDPASHTEQSVVGGITATVREQGVGIEISFKGPLIQPHMFRLTDPERLVFDFVGATPEVGFRRQTVGQDFVLAVRTALLGRDAAGRPITRVVVDLSQPSEVTTKTESGKYVILVSKQSGLLAKPASRSLAPTKSESTANIHPRPVILRSLARGTPSTNQIESMQVSRSSEITTVVLTFSRPAKFSVFTLDEPPRFVLDFPHTGFGRNWKESSTINVDSASIKSIRSAMFSEEPPMLRVVFDQLTNVSPRISAENGNLILEFPTGRTNGTWAVKRAPVEPQRGLVRSRTETTAKVDMNERPREEVRPLNTASTQTETAPMKGITPNPPIVKFENGLLSVDADNSMLTDVLYAISEKTGATIQLPFSDGMLDRVVIKIGPTTPRMVLSTLLEGTAYNYYLVEGSNGRLEKVLLTPK